MRIASYNVLNYPATSSIRNPNFRTVVRAIAPEILVLQEMTSAAGMTEFLTQVVSAVYPGQYSAAPFNDGPDTDNGLIYQTAKVAFLGATYIPTALRDIAEYRVRLLTTGDTLRLYSLHLKASSGSSNEQLRLAEATILRNHLNALPAGTKFLVVGDYNIYRSSEPAFLKLIGSESDNDGRCFDQLNLVGDWGTLAFAPWHTQSPRVRAFDGGSTGGMDDRFDIMLSSDSMRSRLLTASITAFGNDGLHYNDSINHPPNMAVPDSIADALHYGSDHLPVYGDAVFSSPVTLPPIASTRPATTVSSLSGVLNASVTPNGLPTSARFAYGISPNLDDTTTAQSAGSGSDSVAVATPVSGLQPGMAYSFRVIATNTAGTATGGILGFETLPLAPFAVTGEPTGVTTTTATLNGSVNPNGFATSARFAYGTGANLTDSTPVQNIGSGTTLVPLSAAVSDLQPGTIYFVRMLGTNSGGTAAGVVETLTTVPLPPVSPLLISPPENAGVPAHNISFVWNFPAGSTGYRLQIDSDSSFGSPLLDDSTLVDTTATIDSLTPGPLYFWRVQARNAGGDGPFSAPRRFSALHVVTVGIAYAAEWNLVSLPVGVSNASTAALFPVATSTAFRFAPESGYLAEDTLVNGVGYWLKFDQGGTAEVIGLGRDTDSIALGAGWNLIGSTTTPIDTSAVVFIPPGIRASEYFAYDGAFEPAGTITPGHAYWVKVTSAGVLVLSPAAAPVPRPRVLRHP